MNIDIKPQKLADMLGISYPYAVQLLNGRRGWPDRLAIDFYRKTGQKIAALSGVADDEIDVIDRFFARKESAA